MSFAKRKTKARVIRTNDDEEDDAPMRSSPATGTANTTTSRRQPYLHFSTSNKLGNISLHVSTVNAPKSAVQNSKPFKQSSLRQSIAISDHDDTTSNDGSVTSKPAIREVDFGPSRPATKKKRPAKAASRLSFGPEEIISGDAAEALDEELFTPKKTGRKIEPSSLRISLNGRDGWDGPASGPRDEAEQRPRYSRDYLQELKGSTRSTPKEMQGAPTPEAESEEGLDASELEGAMIVDTEDTGRAYIPTEAEIAEKKARRHRLAQEQDFISLESGPDDRHSGGSMISQLSSRPKKESRLVRDDEDVMEGFDDMVQDNPLALGRKAEREARRQQRKMISQAIQDAEGSDTADSDDSEAERNAEYEAAQTRAGMDGLKKLGEGQDGAAIPPKITPIPSLGECIGRLKMSLEFAEKEMVKRQWEMGKLEAEKREIEEREKEVQRLLKEAGDRYASLRVGADAEMPDVDVGNVESYVGAADSLRRFNQTPVGRGLDSIGNTPIGGGELKDVD